MSELKRARRVYICSPLRGVGRYNDPKENERLAEMLCRIACIYGYAPFAPHLYFPRFLNDRHPPQRRLGLRAGLCFLEICDEVWVYTRRGISEGMQGEIKAAKGLSIPVVWDPPVWRAVS